MKKLWKLIDLINVRISAVVIFIACALIGEAKPLFLLFLIALIHEAFHLIVCILLKVKVESFEILPFGVSLHVKKIENISSLKQIFVYIAGPLSCFVNLPVIYILYKYSFINEVNSNFLLRINYSMCIVNLLPIFPLDGYMIFKAFLQLFFPYKKSLKCSTIVSIISFVLFLTYNFISFQPMISCFLLIEQIKHVYDYKTIYKNFLIDKSMMKKKKRYKVIQDYQMYKDVNNYKIEKEKVLNDADIAAVELKQYI